MGVVTQLIMNAIKNSYLFESKSRGGSFMLTKLIPFLLGDMLGNQAMSRLDFRECFSLK